MSHSAFWLIVDSLAVYRLSVLVCRDTITEPLRRKLGAPWMIKAEGGGHLTRRGTGPRYWLWQIVICVWCSSLYLAAAVVLLTKFWPSGWQYAAFGLALSAVAGFLGER
jgi:hypothetical protein